MPIPDGDPMIAIPMVTPFDDRQRVDLDSVANNVGRWQETPLSAFIVGTVSGEEEMLSEAEKLSVAAAVAQSLRGDRFVAGGIDCPGVLETLRRAEAFAEAGAEMVRIRFPREPGQVVPYFEQLLPRCPLPVLLMHQCSPKSFGVAAAPAAAPEVLGEVANMDGVFGYVTDHDVRFESRVRPHVRDDRRFWICNGSLMLAGALIGCNGTTTAFSNLWPEAMHQLLTLGMAGQFNEARMLQEHVCRIDAVMLPHRAAGIKAALNLLGFDAGQPRAPTPPMPPAEVSRLEVVMREAGLLT